MSRLGDRIIGRLHESSVISAPRANDIETAQPSEDTTKNTVNTKLQNYYDSKKLRSNRRGTKNGKNGSEKKLASYYNRPPPELSRTTKFVGKG